MFKIRQVRRDLLISLLGRMVSTFGDEVALVALTLRLQAEGGRPWEVALLLAAGIMPLLVLAPLVGRLTDSHDSRRLLVGAGTIEVVCTVPLIFLHSVLAIILLVTVLGAAAAVGSATWSALVPRIVGEDHVGQAISAQQSLNALVMVAGPAVGGLLAGTFGTGSALAVDAVTFVVLTVAAALVRTRRKLPRLDSDGSPARGGFRILRTDHVLGPLVIGLAVTILFVGMTNVVLVFLIRVTLHAGGAWYGLADAAWMTGVVAGSLGGGRVRSESAQTWATIAGAGVACAALAPFAAVPAVWMLLPLSVVGGAGNGYTATCFGTLLIRRTADAERGRAAAAANAAAGGAQGTSLLLGGAIAAALDLRAIFALAGVLGAAVSIMIGVLNALRGRQTARTVGRASTSCSAAQHVSRHEDGTT
jgi:MFS family permease